MAILAITKGVPFLKSQFLSECVFGCIGTSNYAIIDTTGPKRESADHTFTDFHEIFWLSDASVNPDTLAYFFFKHFSGNIPFKDVCKMVYCILHNQSRRTLI